MSFLHPAKSGDRCRHGAGLVSPPLVSKRYASQQPRKYPTPLAKTPLKALPECNVYRIHHPKHASPFRNRRRRRVSNYVIILLATSEKPRASAEIFRLLKPSGRVAAWDVLALAPLPDGVREDAALYAGCVAVRVGG